MTSPAFAHEEYIARQNAVLTSMADRGLDTLVVTEPANMCYLTGYDGWSFYTPQCLLVAARLDEPVLIVRGMDANAGKVTTHLKPDNILGFPDHYVQQPDRHAMDWVAEEMGRRGIDGGVIGLEMDSYYFSPMAYEHLKAGLPNARIANANNLVNWVRAIKSPAELAYMRDAARIITETMRVGIEAVAVGTRQCDAVAAIYGTAIRGVDGLGGRLSGDRADAAVRRRGLHSPPHLVGSTLPSGRSHDPGTGGGSAALPLPHGPHRLARQTAAETGRCVPGDLRRHRRGPGGCPTGCHLRGRRGGLATRTGEIGLRKREPYRLFRRPQLPAGLG
jgi:hypothetical protein